MPRLAIAALLAGFLAVPAWSQMRHGGFAGSRGGFVSRGSISRGSVSRASVSRSSAFARGGFGFARSPRFFPGNRFFVRRPAFLRRPFFYGRPFFSLGFSYPAYGGYGPGYGYAYPVGVPAPPYSSYYGDEYYERERVGQDLEALNGKVDRLREDVEARLAVPRPPARTAQSPEARPTTVLVFHDQHTREVQNYAIAGDTLWIFSEQRAEKVPLSSIDVDATTQRNDERGVDFTVSK